MYSLGHFVILLLFFPIIIFSQNGTKNRDTTSYQLNQITVSASRYPEEILKIPFAVSVIKNYQLNNVRGYGLDEVLSSVPGAIAQSRAGTQDVRLVIRGFGARGAGDRSNSGTSRGIRVMIDNIPDTEPDGRTSFDNIDLSLFSEAEIVRSNASALWGNAAGGVINFTSMPFFEKPFISTEFFFGNYGFKKFIAKAGTSLGNGRLNAGISRTLFDGWRNHSAGKRSVLAVSLTADINSQSKLGIYLIGSSDIFHIPGPLTKKQFEENPEQANSFYEERDERRYNRLGRIGVTFDHSLSETNGISAMLFVNPKYLQRSERGTFRDFTRYHLGGNFIFRNSIKLSESIDNNLMIGIDEAYQDGAILFYSLSSTNSRGNTLQSNKREGANNFGAFLQEQLSISNWLSISAGFRYDNITYYSEDYLKPDFGLQEKTFKKILPKAGIVFRVSSSNSIYGNIGSGIEVPAGNETDPAGTFGQDSVFLLNPLLDPISSTSYEIGAKGVVLSNINSFIRSLTYELALYYIDITNDIIQYRGGRFYFTAGETFRTGIEFGSVINFMYGLSFSANFTYSNNEYKNYIVDSIHYGRPGRFADYKGNRIAGLPDFFYHSNIIYEPEFAKPLLISLSNQGLSDYFVDDANLIEVPAYNITNATIGVRTPIRINNYLEISGFISISNIFNKKYIASAFINPDYINGIPVYLEPGLPTNYTVSLSIGFK